MDLMSVIKGHEKVCPFFCEDRLIKGSTYMDSLEMVEQMYHLADDKKGQDIVICDLRGLSDLTDFFLIVSGNSSPHVSAIAENVERGMRNRKNPPTCVDGGRDSSWIVLDFFDVMVHVFHKDTRQFYDLERLWADAPRIEIEGR